MPLGLCKVQPLVNARESRKEQADAFQILSFGVYTADSS